MLQLKNYLNIHFEKISLLLQVTKLRCNIVAFECLTTTFSILPKIFLSAVIGEKRNDQTFDEIHWRNIIINMKYFDMWLMKNCHAPNTQAVHHAQFPKINLESVK